MCTEIFEFVYHRPCTSLPFSIHTAGLVYYTSHWTLHV